MDSRLLTALSKPGRQRWSESGKQAEVVFRPETISNVAFLCEMRRYANRELMLRRPFGPLLFHDRLKLEKSRQGYCTSCSGNVQRRVCRQAKERAEFPGEGTGQVLPRILIMKDSSIRRLSQIRAECHSATELCDLSEVASLEMGEFLTSVSKRLLLSAIQTSCVTRV